MAECLRHLSQEVALSRFRSGELRLLSPSQQAVLNKNNERLVFRMTEPICSKLTAFFLSGIALAAVIDGRVSAQLPQKNDSGAVAVASSDVYSESKSEVRYVVDGSKSSVSSQNAQSFQDVGYQAQSEAAQSFLASLNESQRSKAVLSFDNFLEAQLLCTAIAECKEDSVGLKMSALNTAQKKALDTLLMQSLMDSDQSLADLQIPLTQPSAFDGYIIFFGEPAAVDKWGVRFESDRLSLNLIFRDEVD